MRRLPVDHAKATPGRISSISALLLSGLILICPKAVEAQDWNGSVSDLWGTAANWTPNTVPHSSTATVTVTNATNNPVLIDIAPTIANLTLGGSNSVTLENGQVLTMAGGGGSTISDAGNIQLNGGSGTNTFLLLNADTTLQGGGTVTLSTASGGGTAVIQQAVGGLTLTNVDNTIQGAGVIGNNGLTLVNGVGGTILANAPGQTLLLNGGGNFTNNGTFQANSGSTLFMDSTLTNYNPGTSTLTGGTYNAFSGTIELSQANTGTGAVITTNAATILLDGAAAKIADGSGNNILQGFFTTNAGHFTIQNGANLTSSSSDFTNAGTMTVGANSTFTVGGSHNYLNSGLLEGIGTVQANLLSNSGTVHPGDGPGILTVTGNYSQTSSGALGIQIGGSSAGTGFSQLNVSGSASLAGTLDLSLINGFTPFNGEQFVILTSSGLSGSFLDNTIPDGNVTFTVEYSPPGFLNDVVLDASVSSPVVPEPASWLMLGLGLTAVGTCVVRKSKSQARGK